MNTLTADQIVEGIEDVIAQIADLDDERAPISIGDVRKMLEAIRDGEGFALLPKGVLL